MLQNIVKDLQTRNKIVHRDPFEREQNIEKDIVGSVYLGNVVIQMLYFQFSQIKTNLHGDRQHSVEQSISLFFQ